MIVPILWRGRLLPLECAALPRFGAATQPSGSKRPRHKSSDYFLAMITARIGAGSPSIVLL